MKYKKKRAEKIKKYMTFRRFLKQGKIQYYKHSELLAQMKALQQTEGITSTKISKPSGGKDDYPDSFLLSAYNYLSDEVDFDTTIVDHMPLAQRAVYGDRYDTQLGMLKGLHESDEFKLWRGVLK